MLVQMRSPFSGQWLKIDAEDGTIIEFAAMAWQDIPHLPAIAISPGPHTKATAITDLNLGPMLPDAVHAREAI